LTVELVNFTYSVDAPGRISPLVVGGPECKSVAFVEEKSCKGNTLEKGSALSASCSKGEENWC
jgi:hypothetical protein